MISDPLHAHAEAVTVQPRVLILLCTFNEMGNLPTVFEVLWHAVPHAEILVVDDNSPDGTGRWARQQADKSTRVFAMIRKAKLGLGSALRDGLEWSLSRDYEFVINLDADLSHNPADASKLLAGCLASQPRIDVAIGSRYVAGGGVVGLSAPRSLASKLLNAYATRLLGLPVRDCSGSFRCYRSSALRLLDFSKLKCNGYGFLEEILCHLYRQGATLAEFPITYEHRHAGRSKLSISDACGALAIIHRLAISNR